MAFNLKEKAAIVTGSSRGIGRAIALALAQEGVKVVVNYGSGSPDGEALAYQVVRLIRTRGGKALAIQADVSRRSEVAHMVKEALARFGRLDILVNNAGTTLHDWLMETTDDDWDRVFAVNVRGCFYCTQVAAQQMIEQGAGGRIINISSKVASRPILRRPAYAPSKAAVEAFTKCCALELAPYGITVNGVAPGATRTGINPAFADPAFLQALESTIPLGKIAESEDIASVVLFLASDGARQITGDIVHVDGGQVAGRFRASEAAAQANLVARDPASA